jgi:hypothetical protein
MFPAGNWRRKVKENSQNSFGTTYPGDTIALEYGVMDLHFGTGIHINCSALEVACPAPGIGVKK